jgi:ribosomal protein L11 methylase PrmA
MTLIQVAKETGASVIGIDIDPQAVDLGQRVVNVQYDTVQTPHRYSVLCCQSNLT